MTKNIITSLLLLFLFTGCMEINSSNPEKSFEYWSGHKPEKEVEVINGKYWQSAHWSLEYIVYLKIKPSKKWWGQFIEQNNLSRTTIDWAADEDTPEWFNPPANSLVWLPKDDFFGTRIFLDKKTHIAYIYDIQL